MKLVFTAVAWSFLTIYQGRSTNTLIGVDFNAKPEIVCFVRLNGYASLDREVYCWPWWGRESLRESVYNEGVEAQWRGKRVCMRYDPSDAIPLRSVECDWKKGQRPGEWIRVGAGEKS